MLICAYIHYQMSHLKDSTESTCPDVMEPPCSRAKRELRAAVRTAEAVRPARHTRLGSRVSDRNFSDSSWKCL